MSRAVYQPGAEASAEVRVRGADGRTAESALGVVVFDQAVAERARTEQDFGAAYGFSNYFYQFWYGPESIGGVNLRSIEQLNPARKLPAGLDTVAELLLQRDDDSYQPNFFGGDDYDTNQASVYASLAAAELTGAKDALAARYESTGQYPRTEADLRRLLAIADISLADLRDPWGVPFRAVFSTEREYDVLHLMSAGADKRAQTGDDWIALRIERPYFRPQGLTISRALAEFHQRTGGYVRDEATLKSELLRAGLDLDALRDHWGHPYQVRFGITGSNYIVNILSGGPDGRFGTTAYDDPDGRDDFTIWSAWTDYFAETRTLVDTALAAYLKANGSFPPDEATLREVFRRVGIDAAKLRDPWAHDYYAAFRTETRYIDRIVTTSGSSGGAAASQRTSTTPITQRSEIVTLRSAGADGQVGTPDDFNIAEFSRAVSEQTAHDKKSQAAPDATTLYSGATGAMSGMITDPNGAVVPGAIVTAQHQYLSESIFQTTTDDESRYLFRNLPAGLYTVRVEANGFVQAVVMEALVQSSVLSTVNFSLLVGTVAEAVTVTSDAMTVDSTSESSMLMSNITSQTTEALPINGRNISSIFKMKAGAGAKDGAQATQQSPIATPRLRKDFPETLFWQPAVETDRNGRTAINFKLADNITTWKMSIIGSTESGEIGTIEQDIRAFQPFFVEHDPPRVLTEGDEISLPVVLRNYLSRPQSVALDIKPEDWFTLLSPAHKQANVPAGDAARETFDFRAVASVKAGLQRITAIGADASDQIEKPVEVHPDGEETAVTATQILRTNATTIDANIPAYVIPHTAHAELKIYPNLSAHVIESVEAILARPYGCAEQTISSTYPSVLVLRHYRHVKDNAAARPPITAKAERYVREGYERLLSYRAESGGFSYWGRGEANLALTAYAVRFLTDAGAFIEVDEDVLTGARDWLIKQQRPDGSWSNDAVTTTITDTRRAAMLTAYIARILAMQKLAAQHAAQTTGANSPPTTDANSSPTTDAKPLQTTDAKPSQTTDAKASATPDAKLSPLQRALAYLAPRTAASDEPYLIASYALAAADAGESPQRVAASIERLRALAHDEAGGAYWSLETNTPFYGWGLAGRIETTALAVQALTRAAASEGKESKQQSSQTQQSQTQQSRSAATPQDALLSAAELQNRGLLFLLQHKDRYGVWLSTQTTVNVLDALTALSPDARDDASSVDGQQVAESSRAGNAAAQGVEVFVNGQSAGTLALPATNALANPVTIDLTRWLAIGDNRIEIKRAPGAAVSTAAAAAAQVVTTYYVPWANSTADGTHAKPGVARALRLAVNFDRTTAGVGDTVKCQVEAERIGHQGYGMLLAEVGLPPGADVDRASLERAMKDSAWEFSHYDVLPDRLIVYLWPRAGGTKFEFTFRPRFGLAARSAASVVYDYYNPEARAVLAPQKFAFIDKTQPALLQATRD